MTEWKTTKNAGVRRSALVLLIAATLVASTAPIAVATLDPMDEVQVTQTEYLGLVYQTATCASKNQGAVPVALIGDISGVNHAVLYQNGIGDVFVSWLMASEMAVGSNTFMFGIRLEQPGSPHLSELFVNKLWEGPEYKTSPCVFVGSLLPGLEFHYKVVAGSAGWQESTSCTFTHQWKAKAGVDLGFIVIAKLLLAGGSLHAEVEFGGSKSCTDGVIYDSEVLIGETGSTVLPSGVGAGTQVRV